LIAIIDYGVGNLRSVEKALQYIGMEAEITSDPERVRSASAVILPGVGAYSVGMDYLRKYGMVDVVKEAVADNKPFLGICLGMQLLFEYSREGGERVEGLGLLPGAIKLLPSSDGLKVPHMGWNSLKTYDDLLFNGLPENPYVYFVHSYYLDVGDKAIVAAQCDYGITFTAAVYRGNVYATQFHPEKSGEVGLKILKNWSTLIK
jgi:glutamine amidotransferase